VIRDEERMIYDKMETYFEETLIYDEKSEETVIYEELTEMMVIYEELTEMMVTHEELTEMMGTYEELFALIEKEKKKQKVPNMDCVWVCVRLTLTWIVVVLKVAEVT
jgi:hypothetical protein